MDSTARPGPAPWVVTAGILILCLIWGSTWLVIREGLADLPPLTSCAVRFVVAGGVMILIAPRIARAEGGAVPNKKLVLVYGVLTLAIPLGVIYQVETVLPSGLVSVLWSVYPLVLACCAHVSLPEERLGPRQWLGLFVGFLGVALLFLTEVASVGPAGWPDGPPRGFQTGPSNPSRDHPEHNGGRPLCSGHAGALRRGHRREVQLVTCLHCMEK